MGAEQTFDKADVLREKRVTPMPVEKRQAARRAVALAGRDPEDRRMLLDMLGLIGPEPHVVNPPEREKGAAAAATRPAAPAPQPTADRPDPHPATLTEPRSSRGRGHRVLPVTARTDPDHDWRHRAICRDEDPELFFPVGNSGPALVQLAEAKTVCRRCPVMSDCLAWALGTDQGSGVWGGLSEDERRALKRRQARARARSNT